MNENQFKDKEYPDLPSDAFDPVVAGFAANSQKFTTYPGGYVLFEWQGPEGATIKFQPIVEYGGT